MSETTSGLPELPEGEYWRVQKRERTGYFYGYTLGQDYEPYELCIYKNEQAEVSTLRTWRGFSFGYRKEIKTVERQVAKEGIKAERQQVADETWKADPEESPDASCHKTYDVSLTPQAIRETAERMLAARAERQRIKSLLGDYPPKKLAEQ